MASSDKDWEIWGKDDPYYGVLTHAQFRKGSIDAHKDEFFASGTSFVTGLLDRYQRHFGDLPRGSALDFGCGVGRLTLAMAAHFGQVDGVDVSPSMLAEARSNAGRLGVANARFVPSDDTLRHTAAQYDFVNTYIVLQHVDGARGLSFVRSLLAKVRPGGGAFIHVSLRRREPASRRAKYWVRFHVPGANAAMNVAKGKPAGTPQMRMTEYNLTDVLDLFHAAGMRDVQVVLEDHDGVLTAGLLAKKV